MIIPYEGALDPVSALRHFKLVDVIVYYLWLRITKPNPIPTICGLVGASIPMKILGEAGDIGVDVF